MQQQKLSFDKQIVKKVRLGYLLALPEHYDALADRSWPLLVFLHGIGGRGVDLERVKEYGIPRLIEEQRFEWPFIIVSPQCPSDSYWPMEKDAVAALIEEVANTYAVDRTRIYLTGLSMGGYGAWDLAIAYPDLFAAVVPICGGGNQEEVALIKHVPVWVFHGAKDNIVPIEESEKMVKALEEADGNVTLTVYADAGHDAWTETYNNPELYEWLLQHQNRKVGGGSR